MKKIVIFGGGNIDRGFIGEVFGADFAVAGARFVCSGAPLIAERIKKIRNSLA